MNPSTSRVGAALQRSWARMGAAAAALLAALASPFSAAGAAPAGAMPAPGLASEVSSPALASPPVARRIPKDVTVHGDNRIDDYFWLRERDNPAVMEHLRAEAAYADQWFKPLQGLQDRLYQEMVARVAPADEDTPARRGAWWYGKRTLAGAQYPQYIRRAAAGPGRAEDPTAEPQVLLDLNELAKGRKFLAVNLVEASRDGQRLLYSLDDSGYRDFQLRIRDLASGQDLPWVGQRTDGAVWSADGRSVFYVTANEARRRNQLWRHQVDAATPDELVFEEKDELFNLQLGQTADGRYLHVVSYAKNATEFRWIPADRPASPWRVVLPRRAGLEYRLEHRDGQLYLLINDRGPNFRLISLPAPASAATSSATAPAAAAANAKVTSAALASSTGALLTLAQVAKARELLPHREDASLERLLPFQDHLVLQWRENATVKLSVLDEAGLAKRSSARVTPPVALRDIPSPEALSSATIGDNREFNSDVLRISYQSLITPPTVVDYRFSEGHRQVRKQQPVMGYDPSRYATERVWATAKDGTRVPISLLYAKSVRREDGPAPLLLRAYGSYGASIDHRFNANDLSLLDRGVVLATAHVRGGGEMGRRWYQDGKLSHKMNTFTDFIACAETLVQQRWTRPDRLIITGRSAGGLLMGVATNLRPDLFKAVVAEVPFVDVINSMLDETIPLTTEEFIEWGNPKRPDEYAWMRAYSPYDNLRPGAYPAILARGGLNDSQVPYWEPAKYVAKLRGLKTDSQPLLFDVNLTAGHGGASGRYDALKERARVYAFMLAEWDLTGEGR
ncbi:oligopeptidase B Serine peptidase. MEROPS family S09A [Roseateles sp. YR242]|uniref:S9 family peptidase n=1 Tax=Roseateles sp. YR242 TaxID=1855305 RepID=UPI0008BDC553|nr:S9 family peptidase [Roseateles sp. YR242]SEL93024.1 oligopeptidase B Serine peptidase. MEROPS family S09A [Roseateles sp. YR242]